MLFRNSHSTGNGGGGSVMLHWLVSSPSSGRNSVLFAVCTIFVFLPFTSAIAGGLYLNEFGTSSMGTAGAGAQAYANDASTAWHNPAGMTRIDGRQLGAGGGLIFGKVKFDPDADTPVDGGNGGDALGFAPIASSHYVHSVSDRFKLGFNAGAITGAALDYDNDWSGRYQDQKITLMSFSAIPAAAFRINEKLSIGGSVNITYGTLDMDVAIPNPEPGQADGKVKVEDADDWDVGFNLGVLFELNEDTRFGVIYFSGIEPDFSGDAKIIPLDLKAGIDIELTFPEMVRGSIYHKLNQKFALLGTVGWEKWSDFDRIPISVGQGSIVAHSGWDDTWHFSGGLHYIPNEKWMFMTGVAYDTSPVGKKHRNAALPVDRQVRLALGTQYHWQENIDVGASIVYGDMGDSAIQGDNLVGDYSDNDLLFIAFNFNWKL
jgi:long-chain fatty acid transport protein